VLLNRRFNLKFGYRTPNIKKSIKARTTGKIKRKFKKTINPVYNKKGIDYITNPKKAIKNNIYHNTTIDTTKYVKKALFDNSSYKQKNKKINTNTQIKKISNLENNKKSNIKNNKSNIKDNAKLSPTTEKIITIISYIIVAIIIGFIIVLLGSFILGIFQGIMNNL
jgi:hypothetical protein